MIKTWRNRIAVTKDISHTDIQTAMKEEIGELRAELVKAKEASDFDHQEYKRLSAELRAELKRLDEQKPCATMPRCTLEGAEGCECDYPCNKLINVYLAAGAKE